MAKPQYGHAHQVEKAKHQPHVDSGQAECAELTCLEETRWLNPDLPWDLAHDRANPGMYLGPAHPRCNRTEGGRYAQQLGGAPVREWRL
jgi:hypothetical protein